MRTYTEEQRRAVFTAVSERVVIKDKYEDVNPELVDWMMDTALGQQVVLKMAWSGLVTNIKKALRF